MAGIGEAAESAGDEFLRRDRWFVGAVVVAGLILRIKLAMVTALNPDEAEHALWAFGSFRDAFHNALDDTHPPLLTLLTHCVSLISRSQVALRLIPVVSGSLFPVLIFFWLRRIAGNIAGMTALLLLTFAPNVLAISAEVRTYSLALLLMSAALLVLEEALQSGRPLGMAGYSALLWLCILSDFSMAWFAGGAAIYAALRLRGSPGRLQAVWAAGQAGALAIYAALFTLQVQQFRGGGMEREAWSGWLRNAIPHCGEPMFPVSRTADQFAYLMASALLGKLALLGFAAAVIWLALGRTSMERRKARALVALLTVPFLLGIAGAYVHLFPYGRTRHTMVLGVLGAIGAAMFVGMLPKRPAMAMLWGMLLLVPVWQRWGRLEPDDLPPDRNRKAQVLACLDYMRARIPLGARIFTEQETYLTLAYYLGDDRKPVWHSPAQFYESTLGGRWRAGVRDYSYPNAESYAEALAAFRRQFGLTEHEPVWVIDGGWNVVSAPEDPERPFTRAVRVFEAR